jgi:hypothetical protein
VQCMQGNKAEEFHVLRAANIKVTVFWDVMFDCPEEPATAIFLESEYGPFTI